MKAIKTYIPAPNSTTAPSVVQLGHIFEDLFDIPSTFVNLNSHVPVKPKYLLPIDSKTNFTASRKKLLSCSSGIWASFLGMFGVGMDAEVKLEKCDDDVFTIKTLDTVAFLLTEEYIRESMAQEEVEIWLDAWEYKKPAYMVTGMKIARGASLESQVTRTSGGKVKLGFGHPGIPAEGGPQVGLTKETTVGQAFEDSTDFILAYRIVAIKRKGGNFKHKYYTTKGSMQGADKAEDTVEFEVSVPSGEGETDIDDEDESEWIIPPDVRSVMLEAGLLKASKGANTSSLE